MQKVSFKGSVLFGPVPTALITTLGADDRPNVFTVGWIGVACTKPPMLSIAIRKERVSHENLTRHPECVVNLPTQDMVQAVDFCGCRSAAQVDKIAHCQFELEAGEAVSVPSIKACPIALECVVKSVTELGTHDLFLVEILKNKVDSGLIDEAGKIHMEWGKPLAYLHGTYYSLGGKPLGTFGFSVARKKAARVKARQWMKTDDSLDHGTHKKKKAAGSGKRSHRPFKK